MEIGGDMPKKQKLNPYQIFMRNAAEKSKTGPDKCYDLILELATKAAESGAPAPVESDLRGPLGKSRRTVFSYIRDLVREGRIVAIRQHRQPAILIPNTPEFMEEVE